MKTSADQLTISHINQKLILDTIKEHGMITRANLSQLLHLSPPSVSSNIEKLLQKRLVLEYSTSSIEGPGRKGKLLGLNPDYSYIVCVDLSSPMLGVGIGNVKEEIVDYHQFEKIEDLNAQELLSCIESAISNIMSRNNLSEERIGAIIVCSPGVINEFAKKIEYVPQFPGWSGANVWSILRQKYGEKLILINDINAIAMGELQVGVGKIVNSFVCLNVDIGIGGGIIVNNQLLEGVNLAAGELGFMMTSMQQLEQPSREKGNLEKLISIQALRKRLAQKLELPFHALTIPAINDLYRNREPVVVEEIENLIRMLAMCIVNISAVLNVPVVCIGGMIRELEVDLDRRISALIQNMVPYPPKVCISQLGNTGFLYGALHLGSEKILQKTTGDF